MAPSENIYRSDVDVVDGLDIVDMMEDDQYESVLYDDVDDGQPTICLLYTSPSPRDQA